MVTTHTSCSQLTSRTMPRSSKEITGISGSGTVASTCMTCSVLQVCVMAITKWRQDTYVAGAAFLPTETLTLPCDGLADHHGRPCAEHPARPGNARWRAPAHSGCTPGKAATGWPSTAQPDAEPVPR